MEFKAILAKFLDENELTQTQFAQYIDVKPSQVSEWLSGKAKPGYDTLRKICAAFNEPPNYWLDIE